MVGSLRFVLPILANAQVVKTGILTGTVVDDQTSPCPGWK